MDMTKCFKMIVDKSQSPIVVSTTDLRIVYANELAEANYKKAKIQYRRAEQFTGNRIDMFFDEETMSRIYMAVEWFREDINNNRLFAFHTDWNNGDMYICALRDEDGSLEGFYSVIEVRSPDVSKEFDVD
ncbi:MAG: hypothetical protein IJ779_09710 [Ruminococcus sp.]|nr:hypothetical protein [Ruminococcus sp.]